MIHEFADPIAVETPLGKGHAIFIDTSAHENWWTVAIAETQALVTFPQHSLRIHKSYTHRRGVDHEQMKVITR